MRNLVLLSLVLFGTAAVVLAVSRGRLSVEASTGALPRAPVAASTASNDGTETYRVQVFEPWNGSEQRIVLLEGASVDEGLPALHTFRTLDSALGSEEATLNGRRTVFHVGLRVNSWAQVATKEDLIVSVTE